MQMIEERGRGSAGRIMKMKDRRRRREDGSMREEIRVRRLTSLRRRGRQRGGSRETV